MKNWIGLLIALSLGVVACLLNWKYLERKSKEIEVVSFLAVADGTRINAGDTFLEEHFTQLDIPRKNVGPLTETAVLYEDRHAVASMKAIRDYRGGEIILRQELKTPPQEFSIKDNELAMWIPVNSATFVPSLVRPGDMVSFVVPDPGTVFREINQQDEAEDPIGPEFTDSLDTPEPLVAANSELVGPFRVLSLGERLGSYEVNVASGGPRARENVMGIAVNRIGESIDPKAEKLVRWMSQPNFRQAAVVLHPRPEKK